MENKIMWWGYIHIDESVHLKRYFDKLDISDALDSPFVKSVYGPWEVNSREEALKKLTMESAR